MGLYRLLMTNDRAANSAENKIPVGPEHSRAWVEVATTTRMLRHLLGQVGPVIQDSLFHRLDSQFPDEKVSTWNRGFLEAALEQLEFLGDHVAPLVFHREQEVTWRFRPVQTLSRASMEAAAQAIWMMDGKNDLDCLTRHLQLIHHDLDEQAKATFDAEKTQIQQQISALLENLPSGVKRSKVEAKPNYHDLVTKAAKAAGGDGRRTFLSNSGEVGQIWRGSAGSAHGKQWPAKRLQLTVAVGNVAETDGATMLIADPDAMTQVMQLADALQMYAVMRFIEFAGYGPFIAGLWQGAQEFLASHIPRQGE